MENTKEEKNDFEKKIITGIVILLIGFIIINIFLINKYFKTVQTIHVGTGFNARPTIQKMI